MVAVVQENRRFYDDFVLFLKDDGYDSVQAFVREESNERAVSTIAKYMQRESDVKLFDGILRPYANSKAKWYFLAWLLRDAPAQRLQPLLKTVPGKNAAERRIYLLNEVRKFVEPLFPSAESWEWPAVSEVMLARLEGQQTCAEGDFDRGGG